MIPSTFVPVPAPLAGLPWSQQTLYRGAEIFKEGQPVESVYYLESGLVKLSRQWDTPKPLIVRLVCPGELVGDRPAQAGQLHSHSAEVLTTSRCASLPLAEFQQLASASPEVLFWIANQVEQRLADAERRVALIAFARVELRLLSLLADIAGVHHGAQPHLPESVNIPISQADLAQLAGATRETASTILNTFERRGLLRLGRRQIEVVSLEALRQAVHDEQAGPGKDRAKSAHA